MAFTCPKCGAVAATKTSKVITNETRRSYHQCQNLLCGCTFTTLTAVEFYLTNPSPQPLPADFEIPKEGLPKSHFGERQLDMF